MEEGASGRLDKIVTGGRGLISREDLLKYLRSSFEGLSLRNIESLQEIISPKQEKISEVEDDSYLGDEVKM